jgi:hypothetical protein
VGAEFFVGLFVSTTIKAQAKATIGYIGKYESTETVTKTHIKKLSLSTYVWHFNETGPDN